LDEETAQASVNAIYRQLLEKVLYNLAVVAQLKGFDFYIILLAENL